MSDTALMADAIEKALARNSNHVDTLLLLADRSIDAEDYPQADRLLDQIQEVNPWNPEAWAFRAVVAHLRHRSEAEAAAREKALKYWTNQSPRRSIDWAQAFTELSVQPKGPLISGKRCNSIPITCRQKLSWLKTYFGWVRNRRAGPWPMRCRNRMVTTWRCLT